MRSFLSWLRFFLKDNISRLLLFRESGVKNFIAFTLCYAALNICTRLILLGYFSDSFNAFVIYWIVTIISVASLFSVVVFYITKHHTDKIESFLSRFVDVKRVKENKRKRIEVHRLAEQQFNLDLRYKNLIIFVFLLFPFALRSQSFPFLLILSFCACAHIFYSKKIDRALQAVEIPPELMAQPSRFTIKVYESYYVIIENIKVWLWGPSTRSASSVESASRAAENLTRRQFNPGAIYGTVVATFTLIGGVYAGVETYYTTRGYVSPMQKRFALRDRGYQTDDLETLHMARELEAWGCDMKSFCYPNTSTLDQTAIRRATKYINYNSDNGKAVGEEVPLPIGPHPFEFKESSFNEDLKKSVAPIEGKEISFISDI